jgi:hypothetical protein
MAETPVGSTEKNLILMTVPPSCAIHLHSSRKIQLSCFFALEEDRTAALTSEQSSSKQRKRKLLSEFTAAVDTAEKDFAVAAMTANKNL